jgi:hypothetical protein
MILKTESKPPKPKSPPCQNVEGSGPAAPKAIKLMTTPSTVGPRRAVDISYLGSVLSVNSVVKSDTAPSHPVTPCTREKNKKISAKPLCSPVGVHASACPIQAPQAANWRAAFCCFVSVPPAKNPPIHQSIDPQTMNRER